MRDAAARAVERHVGYLRVSDQHVGAFNDVPTVSLDDSFRGSLDHVGRGFVRPDVMAELGRTEHQVGRQVIRAGEIRVIVCADRFSGQVGGDIGQADGGLVHGSTHFIQAGVIGRPLRWRYSAIVLRLFSSSPWPAPNKSQKSPTQPVRCGGPASG